MSDPIETTYPIYNQYVYKNGVGWVMMGASDGSSGATIQINDGTVRNLNTLVINRLTRAEFEALTNPSPDQLYIITDDVTYATINDLPQPGNATPQKDGTGNAGSASTYSRSDHVHPAEIPSQTNNSGKFLTTNGSTVSWATVDALPSQTNNSGKYLTTNGSVASWSTVTVPTKTSDLTNDSGYITISDVPAAGETNQNAYTTIKVGSTDVTSTSKTGTFTVTAGTGIGLTPNTTSKSMEIKNTGVTAIAESTNNGKLSVTQNGETNDISIHGLGTAAYENSGNLVHYNESKTANTVLAAPNGINGVPTFRKLAAEDIPNLNYVPTSRKVNGKQLNQDITLSASDVSAIPSSEKGAASGVAELDSGGKVPSSQLPSYVDDVLEYSSLSNFPAAGETGKIYIDTNSKKTYRWSGTQYVEISPSLALGETSSTAYRGDRGKIAYDHASAKGSAFSNNGSDAFYKFQTNAEGHVTSVTGVTKTDITNLGIPAQDTTYVFDGTYNASSNKAATVSTVTNAINALDVPSTGTGAITGFGAGKTLASLTETNGKISATFQDISITQSQISDFPSTMTPSSHSHGYVSNDGKVLSQSAIGNGDRLVITDSSDSDKIATSSITFGTSTTTFLTNKGTWKTPDYPVTSINSKTGTVVLTAADVGAATSSHTHGDITNDGDITTTATIASGDRLVINDESASKVTNSSITFGDAQNLFLANDGTWQRPQGIFSVIANYDTYTNKWVGRIDTPELYDGLTMVLFLSFDPNENVDETSDGEIYIKLTLNDNTDTDFEEVVSNNLDSVYTDYFTKGNSIILTYWDVHNYDNLTATGTYKWFTNEPLPESDGNIANMLDDLGLVDDDASIFSTMINSNSQNIIDETGNIIVNSYINQGGGFS